MARKTGDRRVLIVAYHFHPEPASGARRMTQLARRLPAYGWIPTVVTRRAPGAIAAESNVVRVGRAFEPPGIERTETSDAVLPPAALRRVKSFARDLLFIPDRTAWWIPYATAAGLAAHRRHGFDALITSAMPASVHLSGCMLSSVLGVPWLADYRDLWSGNPYVVEPHWRAQFMSFLERRALGNAARITTITDALAEPLARFHRRNVDTIPNASDPSEWDGIPFERPDCFRIVHAGSLYDGLRSPEPLFAQVAALRAAGDPAATELRIDFYGRSPGDLLGLAGRYGLEEVVRYHGVVERIEAMRAQRSSALLLVIQNDDPRTGNEYGSKIFEYQGAGRSILALGPPGSVLREYVTGKQLGWFGSTPDEIRGALREAYARYKEGRPPDARGSAETADDSAAKFAAILDEMAASRRRAPGAQMSRRERLKA